MADQETHGSTPMFGIFLLRCVAALRGWHPPPCGSALPRCLVASPLPQLHPPTHIIHMTTHFLQHVLAVFVSDHPLEAVRRQQRRWRGGELGKRVAAHWRPYGALLLYQGGVQLFLQVVKTWSTGKGSNGKGKKTSSMIAHLRTVFSNRMLVAWLAWGLVLWCVCWLMASFSCRLPSAQPYG